MSTADVPCLQKNVLLACCHKHSLGVARSPNGPPILFLLGNSFLTTELKMDKQKNWCKSGERDVCILWTGSNQFTPSF